MKYQKEFEERFFGKIFSTRDVKIFLQSKNSSLDYVSLFLNSNLKRKKIVRLKRGHYSFSDNLENVEKIFSPSYHGLQDALSIYGLWQQQTIPVLITPRKVRSGERMVLDSKILVRRINRKMFFGFEEKKYFDSWITISDMEKTLIDFVYYGEPLDKQTLRKMKKKINMKTMNSYLKLVNKKTREKVLGLLK